MRPSSAVIAFIVLAAAPSLATEFSCDEAGVLAAIAAGGGPHTFDCAGPTTVVTTAELVVPHAVELDGEGLLTLSGGNTHRVMRVEGVAPFTATLRNLDFTQGVAPGTFGGCVYALADLTLVGVEVHGCQAAFGGGIAVVGAQLTLDGCNVAGNVANAGEVSGFGGGVSTSGTSGETIVVTNSTIRGNTANLGGGIGNSGQLTITGSTIAENAAGFGGGIVQIENGFTTISRSTISDNRATNASGGGGGGIFTQGLSLVIQDSTLARNSNAAITNARNLAVPTVQITGSTIAANIGSLPTALNQLSGHATVLNSVISGRCTGVIQNLGGNFQSPGMTCAGVSSTALELGKLGDHGGPTQTIPLLPGSVAIDAADGCPPPATDQRGVARPHGAACDSGAFEQDFPASVPALPPAGVAALLAALTLLGACRAAEARMRRLALFVVLLLSGAARAAVFSCDEPGVLAAIAAGGGPHTFSCAGPTTVVTSAALLVSGSVELDGGGLLTLSGGGAHQVMSTSAGTTLTLRDLALRDGHALPGDFAGCIQAQGEMTLDGVEVSGCEAPSGAAILGGGGLTLTDSDVHDNVGIGVVGGFGQVSVTRTRIHRNAGGAVASGTPTFVTESTITGNTADVDAGIVIGGESYVVISRSTVANNRATSPNGSGGLGVRAFAAVDDSTFVGNLPMAIHAYQWGPGFPAESVTIRSSTLIGNPGPSTLVIDPPPPPAPHIKEVFATIQNTILHGGGGGGGSILDRGGNLFVPPDGVPCSAWAPPEMCATKAETNLGKLGPHGGPTWTVPLYSPSAAIDRAPSCTSATDQRGVARPYGSACDAGAFEWDDADPEVPALPPIGVAVLAAALLALARRRTRG